MLNKLIKKTTNDNLNKLKIDIINLIKDYNKFYELEDKEIFDDLEDIFIKYSYK